MRTFKKKYSKIPGPFWWIFGADWCRPCHMIAPAIEEVAADFEGRAKVGKLDVDANGKIAGQYGIRSIPAILLFKDGQVVDQVLGVAPKSELTSKLNDLIQNGEKVKNELSIN